MHVLPSCYIVLTVFHIFCKLTMMFVTSKHVFYIKECRNLLKNHDLLSAVSTFWFN